MSSSLWTAKQIQFQSNLLICFYQSIFVLFYQIMVNLDHVAPLPVRTHTMSYINHHFNKCSWNVISKSRVMSIHLWLTFPLPWLFPTIQSEQINRILAQLEERHVIMLGAVRRMPCHHARDCKRKWRKRTFTYRSSITFYIWQDSFFRMEILNNLQK